MQQGDKFEKLLHQYWGYDGFRGIQREIIESISSGQDTLGLMPTGGGKSITFQVPALAQPGVCIVVTPLISLMKDQVRNLRNRGIKATAVYSGMSRGDIERALDNCIMGGYKFLYVSPERLCTQLFTAKCRAMEVSFITVDESHCISQWGYDFRPLYLRIADIRDIHPDIPILALTATATPQVVEDIQEKLRFRTGAQVFRMGFERKNLAYIVRPCLSKETEMIHILKRTQGSAIVYTGSRKKTQEIAKLIRDNGISAHHYHAGLDNSTKDRLQHEWHEGIFRVMVATNAFGMGIDKPDVRTVIHTYTPESIEAYFQEAGRAGRDGKKAYAVLLTQPSDNATLKRQLKITYPPKEYIREVYEKLCFFLQIAMGSGQGRNYDFDLETFCYNFHLYPDPAESALLLLTQAGYIEYVREPYNTARLHFLQTRDELYSLARMPQELEEMMQAVLRNFPGLFSDYAAINENLLAEILKISRQQVYERLIALDKRGILNYIPRKRTPLIFFTQDRVEAHHIVIPPTIYEERIKQAEKRIEAMIRYFSTDETCRQQSLISYFGQEESAPCGQCDVCLKRSSSHLDQGQVETAIQHIRNLLSEQGSIPIEKIADCLADRREILIEALEYLLNEHIITLKGNQLTLAPSS